MLSKDAFFGGMDKLVNAFPNWRLGYDDPEVMKDWYDFFKRLDDKRFMNMINQYIVNESRFPTVAGLRSHDTMMRKTHDQIQHEKMLAEMRANE